MKKPNGDEITEHFGILNEKGEIVGQISVQPMEAWVDGQWQKCQYWGDWYRDPAYQGLGLKLLRYVLKQRHLLLATGASRLAYSIYERMKFVLLPIDHRFVFICQPLMAMVQSLRTSLRSAKILLPCMRQAFSRIRRVSLEPGFQFSEERAIDPSLLKGWNLNIPRGTVFVRRDEWFFSWLLDQFPFPEFRLIVLTFKGQQTGYVLVHFRKRKRGLVEGKIVDLFARGWDRSHLAWLFSEGVYRLAELGVHIISYHATHPTFVSLAEKSGFTRIRIQPVIAYGPLASVLTSRESSLHMTYYDHDEAYY